jgi:hypothetical protein
MSLRRHLPTAGTVLLRRGTDVSALVETAGGLRGFARGNLLGSDAVHTGRLLPGGNPT